MAEQRPQVGACWGWGTGLQEQEGEEGERGASVAQACQAKVFVFLSASQGQPLRFLSWKNL